LVGFELGKIAEAAAALEQAFQRQAPLDKKKRPREADWVAALERFHRDALRIREQYRLGLLARAGVAYRLQQRLIAAGYPVEAVRQVVFSLVLKAFIGKG